MKIKDLLEQISYLDPELEVIIGKDREGNDHSPWDGVQLGKYTPETTWYGQWASIDHLVKDGGCGEVEINAIVLYPVN